VLSVISVAMNNPLPHMQQSEGTLEHKQGLTSALTQVWFDRTRATLANMHAVTIIPLDDVARVKFQCQRSQAYHGK